ncbi:MAG: tRNA lysidine(34) synthetase TilS [Halomonadaceae bacterium]|nr:MAG: tRNA lysidine(34) synthetase TilS [Halomonadaceae bacterium]
MGQDASHQHFPRHWPDDLCQAFASLPPSRGWVVALSGGLDSVFLLHCLAQLRRQLLNGDDQPPPELTALHINHGLQDASPQWAAFCGGLCQQLDLPLTGHCLHLDSAGTDLEATAREARYQVFTEHLGAEELLLLAHHRDDQAETLLLRLMRGSGIRGLAGMPASRPLGQGHLYRPLLGLSRARVEVLAREWGLSWCEDSSNQDLRFDRNFVRHQVLPQLTGRWPAALATLNRSAAHCREADELLNDLARQDISSQQMDSGLTVRGLQSLSNRRQRNLVRYRLRQQGLRPPGEERLKNALHGLLTAEPDREPALHWEGHSLRRYRDGLWLVPDLPPVEASTPVVWNMQQPLPWGGALLKVLHAPVGDSVTVTFRQGGERFRPAPDRPSPLLKHWLQEQGVPPWERQRLPLIWQGSELIAIAGLWSNGLCQFCWDCSYRPL